VATVLVDPAHLRVFELDLVERDLWVWPVATAPICVDGPRRAFQIRRRMLQQRTGAWDCAAGWTPVWVSFGQSWQVHDEPLPWSAHRELWAVLAEHAGHVRYRLGLGGVPRLRGPREVSGAAAGDT